VKDEKTELKGQKFTIFSPLATIPASPTKVMGDHEVLTQEDHMHLL
jgi:hypothetical protein